MNVVDIAIAIVPIILLSAFLNIIVSGIMFIVIPTRIEKTYYHQRRPWLTCAQTLAKIADGELFSCVAFLVVLGAYFFIKRQFDLSNCSRTLELTTLTGSAFLQLAVCEMMRRVAIGKERCVQNFKDEEYLRKEIISFEWATTLYAILVSISFAGFMWVLQFADQADASYFQIHKAHRSIIWNLSSGLLLYHLVRRESDAGVWRNRELTPIELILILILALTVVTYYHGLC